MGVPSLFRYLHAKYPRLTSTVVENKSTLIKDASGTVNFVHHPNEPNPSGFEVDNLYLDMNGIIHPCTHPEDRPAPKTQKAMFEAIFEYIDRLVCMVRPRAVLYMAIDGVAPRAKMNQQRSRRFRAALDAQAKIQSEAAAREEWEAVHGAMPEKSEAFDSNCITPGTPFMAALAQALRYYIVQKLNYSPGWKHLKVVLSDASAPGEGEHKIMDFIRRQRNAPDHNPNTMHVIYGLDADLIMLALATHEPHFKILREDVFHKDQSSSGCFTCGLPGHQAAQCPGKPEISEPAKETTTEIDHFQKPFIYFHIDVLRKYLYFELQVETPIVTWDPERAIDDWVFLCFFVGNDFLPHLPSLEIREGAIDRLIQIWRSKFNDFGGYLTNNGNIDLARVAILLKELGDVEDEIFRKRREDEKRRRENQKQRKRQALDMAERAKKARETNSLSIIAETMANVPSYSVKLNKDEIAMSNREAIMVKKAGVDLSTTKLNANKAAALALKAQLKAKKVEEAPVAEIVEEVLIEGTIEPSMEAEEEESSTSEEDEDTIMPAPPVVEEPKKEKRKKPLDEEDDSEPEDHIRLWENGWKDRYYKRNFDIEGDNVKARREIVTNYMEGCCWVLQYYYQGCPSWQWYYPYHYSPFAKDCDFIAELEGQIKFTLGEPFKPFEQLMGVLPAASRMHLPVCYHPLMTEQTSEIIDFYPLEFPIDMNGKKHAWQGVALLPFIDENRLLKAMEKYNHGLTEEEVIRNSKGPDVVFVAEQCRLFESMTLLYTKKYEKDTDELLIDPKRSKHIFGHLKRDSEVCLPGTTMSGYIREDEFDDFLNVNSISAVYKMVIYPDGFVYPARLLPNVQMPMVNLDYEDLSFAKACIGVRPGRGRGRGGRYNPNRQPYRPTSSRVDVAVAGRFIRHASGDYGTSERYSERQSHYSQSQHGQSQYHRGYDISRQEQSRGNESYHSNRNNDSYYGSRESVRGYSSQYQQRHDPSPNNPRQRHDYRLNDPMNRPSAAYSQNYQRHDPSPNNPRHDYRLNDPMNRPSGAYSGFSQSQREQVDEFGRSVRTQPPPAATQGRTLGDLMSNLSRGGYQRSGYSFAQPRPEFNNANLLSFTKPATKK